MLVVNIYVFVLSLNNIWSAQPELFPLITDFFSKYVSKFLSFLSFPVLKFPSKLIYSVLGNLSQNPNLNIISHNASNINPSWAFYISW